MEEALADSRVKEKAHTRANGLPNAERRRLPLVRVEKAYSFASDTGIQSLLDLFAGRSQLIIYHVMFGPSWNAGCDGCSWIACA
jgi:predicted dithiol-disulfide oxidoreductase (DUF899 family)